ncbi:hypothetical protein HF1_10480 [Mycoplasma haemofelis str. Langford 1]|uniref:Uncharacterized protein n=1 Tax=Mycoplasma haemofelis (strain Langford 1) TaxID=941640 RepID=E8ZIT5_MYCHL|nr:hypothetical protein HF1_10480 [Mycoplasma haemofelis str. Langford 1]
MVRNVKSLCTPKGFSSISDLINQRKETSLLLTDSKNSLKLEKKYNDIKEWASWTAENKTSNGNKEDLSDWCKESKDKNFYDQGVFSEVYPKFRYRCLDEQKN